MSSLVKIDSIVHTGSGSAASLTGIDGTYDCYEAIFYMNHVGYNNGLNIEVLKGGTVFNGNSYQRALYYSSSNSTTRFEQAGTSTRSIFLNNMQGNHPTDGADGFVRLRLYNFAAAGYDYITFNAIKENHERGCKMNASGAVVVKDASASDGIQITQNSGANHFVTHAVLYGVK